ncbi:MAG: hypothetical protein AB7F43_12855 [Bacteriovoracia bacterium]
MNNPGFPSHYLFYGALYRRHIWIKRLFDIVETLHLLGNEEKQQLLQKKTVLDEDHKKALSQLKGQQHTGIQRPLRLELVLDDTPTDYFLSHLHDNFSQYEEEFFELLLFFLKQEKVKQAWIGEGHRISRNWGRQLAQESILSPLYQFNESPQAVFYMLQTILYGGEFSWKPFLLRRVTNNTLQYELRMCPHRRFSNQEAANLSCLLESSIFKGFTRALLPGINYTRETTNFCLDRAKYEPTQTPRTPTKTDITFDQS